MATYRNIQLSFWTDSKVADDFTPEDKYFYLYLLTNPHTNTCGCYELSMRQMAIETGYSTETIEKLIERFSLIHKIIRYSKENKELLIMNWHKYNWTSSEKLRTSISNTIKPIKTKTFKDYLIDCFNGLERGEDEDPLSDVEEELNEEVDTEAPKPTADKKKEKQKQHQTEIDTFFEKVWKLYIRKEGKSAVTKAAKEEIFKLGYEQMEKCILNYAAQKEGSEKQYILMGSTFFNGRYKDYLESANAAPLWQDTGDQVRRKLQ